ncbi:F-box only protein 13-like [Pistacia vera]|uniref:F-box only protein 13-like n=1 Tax=Pistacia vera TaxID=55513 RepID=UPI0012630A59|nr:F-box only protein 13-like [Pistacia vera]XP_031287038.1 F-box only protein 13-like [Pistacia vera]
MELLDCWASRPSRKRKSPEEDKDTLSFSMDELNQDLLERVLSWLPTSTFFRLSSVCKRWKSVADSSSFKVACSQIPSRDPWFLMVDRHLNHSVVFDSAEKGWKGLKHPPLLQQKSKSDCMPVAASGGLVCFRNASGNFIVCNPVTGSCRKLPPLDLAPENQSLHAIVMDQCSQYDSSYKLVLVFGELPKLSFKVYNSSGNCWEEEISLSRKVDETMEIESNDDDDDDAVYFLSKAGNVVATNMQRSPSKEYSSVITCKDGEEIAYFLSSSGVIVACNLTRKSFSEYPRLLPVFSEYSIDVVQCRGEMLVVLLSEFLESASLRVWRFDQDKGSWHQIAAMPPAMSHEFYGKKVDINCVGAGDQIFICLNSAEHFSYVLCDLVTSEWVDLPRCYMDGEAVEFMSAFSFEPRIEASV